MISLKIPNLKETFSLIITTVSRFPLAVICGLVATLLSCYYLDINYTEEVLKDQIMKIILVSSLGISFFTALKLFSESLSRSFPWLTSIVGVLLLISYYFSLPDALNITHYITHVIFFIVAHLMVAFAPFTQKFEAPGFWNYNKELFLQIITAFFYSLVLYIGLSLALLAIQNLFDVDIEGETYTKLAFIIFGIFSMLYFLGGVPHKTEYIEADETFSKGLSVFTQYILIPLVGIYTIILYLYTCKIIILWDWPRGWIAYLFISYAALGILSYLLVYPLTTIRARVWIRWFSKWFFISLIPLVLVLFLAIYRRVTEYGLTENRYFLFLLDFWLLAMAIYFVFSRIRNIKIIPLTLSIVLLLSTFGPWGAFAWASRNQVQRLSVISTALQKQPTTLSFKDKKSLSSILTYLKKHDNLKEAQPYFNTNIDSLEKDEPINIEQKLLNEYNITYINEWEIDSIAEKNYYNFSTGLNYYTELGGYKYFLNYRNYSRFDDDREIKYYQLKKEDNKIFISDTSGWETSIILAPFIDELIGEHANSNYNMNPEVLTLTGSNSEIKYKMCFSSLNVSRKDNGELVLESTQFDLFFSKK